MSENNQKKKNAAHNLRVKGGIYTLFCPVKRPKTFNIQRKKAANLNWIQQQLFCDIALKMTIREIYFLWRINDYLDYHFSTNPSLFQ